MSYLPPELMVEVLSSLPDNKSTQRTLYSVCLTSRQWYRAAIPLLYRRPRVQGKSFEIFVKAISASKRGRTSGGDLATYVQVLDLSKLVHESSKSLLARLIRRVSGGLRVLIAPQSSFAMRSHQHLRTLRLPTNMQWEPHSTNELISTVKASSDKGRLLPALVVPESLLQDDCPLGIQDLTLIINGNQGFFLVFFQVLVEIFATHIRHLTVHLQVHTYMMDPYIHGMSRFVGLLHQCPNLEILTSSHEYVRNSFYFVLGPGRQPTLPLHTLKLIEPFGSPNGLDNPSLPLMSYLADEILEYMEGGSLANLQKVEVKTTYTTLRGDVPGDDSSDHRLLELIERLERNWLDADQRGMKKADMAGFWKHTISG
ncbi:MAG: hypothetical protein M4579_001729 [Chaenotheca gracillima]|nr:MAG: hypothetical protein M4579_001729 [Chaenotheca gracillima]